MGNGKYLKSELVYEKEHDRFRCPAGKYLTPNPAVCANHKRYVSSSEDCRDCPLASTCPAKRRTSTSHQRLVKRSLDQDLFEEVLASHARIDFHRTSVRADVEVRGIVRRVEAIPLPRTSEVPRTSESADPGVPAAPSCRTSSACSSHFIAGCCAHRWSYSTNTAPALPSNQSRPSTNCQTKNPFALFQQARLFDDQCHALMTCWNFLRFSPSSVTPAGCCRRSSGLHDDGTEFPIGVVSGASTSMA